MKTINSIINKYLGEETVAADVSVDADDVAMPMKRRLHDPEECPIHKKGLKENGLCPVCGHDYKS